MHILLVEDSISDAVLMTETFNDLGIDVKISHAPDGFTALDMLRASTDDQAFDARIDIILLDLNMPKMDGREFLTIVKSDPLLRVIPVIVLSTSSAERDVRYCYEHFANCYLKKPVDLESFAAIARAIDAFWLQQVIMPDI